MPELAINVFRHAVHWLDYWLLLNITGLFIARFWLLLPSLRKDESVIVRWYQSWRLMCLALMVNSFFVLVVDGMEIIGSGLFESIMQSAWILANSYYGHQWILRIFCLFLIFACIFFRKSALPTKRRCYASIAALIGLTFFYSGTSHAASLGNFTVIQLSHWLHLISALVWGGAVVAFYAQIQPLMQPNSISKQQLNTSVNRLSQLATVIFGIVLFSGGYLAWYMLAGIIDLSNSVYDQRLLIKLLFVMLMLLVAARIRFKQLPALGKYQSSDEQLFSYQINKLKQSLTLDRALVALVVLMAVDVSHQVPPIDLVFVQ